MERNNHLLLLRFSALGDILMTVPIVERLACQYPQMQITMVSRPYVKSIFERLPDNVHFMGINPRNYPGVLGLRRLYKELKELHPTMVCDLHDVLRTKVLRTFFRMDGTPVSSIHKDRKARKAFIKAEVKTQQETSFERYQKAIDKLMTQQQPSRPSKGEDKTVVSLSTRDVCCDGRTSSPKGIVSPLEETGGSRLGSVGIAPFAAHPGKIYSLDKMEKVVELLAARGIKVYLFGAGEKEKTLMEEWEKKYDGVESMVGKLPNMAAEMDLIASLDAMLTMDSGNMHLAALTSTPIYSIWGATHPLGGFLGWGQPLERCIQRSLPCRPCSTFGKKPCKYGDYRCLNGITPEEVAEFIVHNS